MKVSEVLEGAAKLIEESGWTTQSFCDGYVQKDGDFVPGPGACFCATGAINYAATGIATEIDKDSVRRGLAISAQSVLLRIIRPRSSNRYDIYEWNDKKGRKKSEVIAALKKAAKAAKAVGL